MDAFRWGQSIQWSTGPEDVLYLGITQVARLHQRVDDLSWFAVLDFHLDYRLHKQRVCTTYDTAKAGVMTWARKHEARIRAEIDAARAARRGLRSQ